MLLKLETVKNFDMRKIGKLISSVPIILIPIAGFAWEQMYIRGAMNDWGATQMDKQLTAQHWHWLWKSTATVNFEYKFDASGNWTDQQNYGDDDTDVENTGDTAAIDPVNPGDIGNLESSAENGQPYIFSFDTEGSNDMRYEVTKITGLAMCGNGFGLTWSVTDVSNKMTQDATNNAVFTKIVNLTSLTELQFKFVPNMQWNDPIGESPWSFCHFTDTIYNRSISPDVAYSTSIYIRDGGNLAVTPSAKGKYKFTVDFENGVWSTIGVETKPAAISNLTAIAGSNDGDVKLVWTAPGDDGTSGDISGGEIKILASTYGITSANFDSITESSYYTYLRGGTTSYSTQGTEHTYTMTGLYPGTTYYFAIEVKDAAENWSSWSNVGVNTKSTAPAADFKPDIVSAAGTTPADGEITVTWTEPDNFDVDCYKVECSTSSTTYYPIKNSSNVPAGCTSWVSTGLSNNVTHYFRMATYDWGTDLTDGLYSVGLSSGYAYVFNYPRGETPDAPANLGQCTEDWTALGWGDWTKYRVMSASFTLSDPDENENMKYNIQFSTYSNFSFCYINSTQPAIGYLLEGATNFLTTRAAALLPEGAWFWQVQAIDDGGAVSGYSSATVAGGRHFGVDVSSPTNVGCSAPGNNSFGVSKSTALTALTAVDNLSGVSQYQFEVSTTSDFNGDDDKNSSWLSENVWSTATLSAGVTYYWRVKVKDNVGNVSGWCADADTVGSWLFATVSTPSAPSGFSGIGTSTASINWSWNDVAGEGGYLLMYSTSGTIIAGLSAGATFWIEMGLSVNTSYYRVVAATNTAGISPLTSVATAYTLANPPSGSCIVSLSTGSITIGWSANDNPEWTIWGILRSTDNFITSTTTAQFSDNLTDTNYTDSGLTSAAAYWYKVQAFNGDEIATGFDVTIETATLSAPDETLPTVGITEPTMVYVNRLTEIQGTASDNVSVATVQARITNAVYDWNGSSWTASIKWNDCDVHPSSWTMTLVPDWVDGSSYTIAAKAQDSAGNWTAVYATATFTYDVSLPTSTVTYPVENGQYKDIDSVAGTAAEAVSGVNQAQLKLGRNSDNKYWNGSEWTSETWNIATGTSSWNYGTTAVIWTTGTYTVWSKAKDNAGNWEAPSSSVTFEIIADTTPTVDSCRPGRITDLSAASFSHGEVVLSWTAAGDDGYGGAALGYILKYGTYQITEANFDSADEYEQSWQPSCAGEIEGKTLPALTAGATYYFGLSVFDEVLNYSTQTAFTSVFVFIREATKLERPVAAPNPAIVEDGFVDLYFNSDGKARDAALNIYDISGRIVFSVSGLNFAKDGWVSYRWNFRDNSGIRVPTGIYLFKVKALNFETDFARFAVLRTPRGKLRPYLDPHNSNKDRRWP